jgi:hypothetical protein
LVDDKTTHNKSYGVQVELWRKLTREAFINKRRPAMRIEFSNGPVLYVIDELTFMEKLR